MKSNKNISKDEEKLEPTTSSVTPAPKKKKKKKKPLTSGTPKSKQPKMVDREAATKVENSGIAKHVTSWEIKPHPLDETLEVLIFYIGSKPVAHIEITGENIGDMMTDLNSRIIIEGDTPITAWALRTPIEKDVPTKLSLLSGDGIIGSLPLTDELLKDIVPQLNKLYSPEPPLRNKFISWVKRHPIWSSILFIPPGAFILYNLGAQIVTNIVQMFQ